MVTEGSVMAVIRASRPSFRNASDTIAFAVHSSFLAAGYSLIATGRVAFSDNLPQDGEDVGIEGWNGLEDSYGFVYLKSEKGLKKLVLVKCLAIGDALVVDVLNLKEQHKEPLHIQINVKEYVPDGVDVKKSNYGEMYKNMQGLVEHLNAGIFNKLEAKEVGSSSSASGRSADRTNEPAYGYPDELQPLPQGLVYPPVPPQCPDGYGDLFPAPGAGIYPSRVPGIDGSMLVGPHDPRWFGTGEHPGAGFPGGILGVPPGVRFDPYGPPDIPGFEPGRFIRQPPHWHRGDPHPDLEHFQGPDYI